MGLAFGEVHPVHTGRDRSLEEGIVDVGHVLHVVHRAAGVTHSALQDIEEQVGGGVAQMGRVVGRDSTDIDADGLVV